MLTNASRMQLVTATCGDLVTALRFLTLRFLACIDVSLSKVSLRNDPKMSFPVIWQTSRVYVDLSSLQ